jgi:hypothetical protein
VPGHDGGRAGASPVAGEKPGQGSEGGVIGPVQPRAGIGPAQDRVLVTQNEDLDVLGRIAAGEQRQLLGGAAEREVEQAQRHDRRSCLTYGRPQRQLHDGPMSYGTPQAAELAETTIRLDALDAGELISFARTGARCSSASAPPRGLVPRECPRD